MKLFNKIKTVIFRFLFSSLYEESTAQVKEGDSKKLVGFDTIDILSVWVKHEYSNSNIVILTDINVEAKDVEFWARIPKGQALEFLKDIVVLYCKDKTELEKLVPSIGLGFATAYGFSGGTLVFDNRESL